MVFSYQIINCFSCIIYSITNKSKEKVKQNKTDEVCTCITARPKRLSVQPQQDEMQTRKEKQGLRIKNLSRRTYLSDKTYLKKKVEI